LNTNNNAGRQWNDNHVTRMWTIHSAIRIEDLDLRTRLELWDGSADPALANDDRVKKAYATTIANAVRCARRDCTLEQLADDSRPGGYDLSEYRTAGFTGHLLTPQIDRWGTAVCIKADFRCVPWPPRPTEGCGTQRMLPGGPPHRKVTDRSGTPAAVDYCMGPRWGSATSLVNGDALYPDTFRALASLVSDASSGEDATAELLSVWARALNVEPSSVSAAPQIGDRASAECDCACGSADTHECERGEI
jgi:hypothetical protein